MEQSLELEVLGCRGVDYVDIGGELMLGKSDDVGKLVVVLELRRGWGSEKSDRYTFGSIHHYGIKSPVGCSGETVLRECGIFWWRRRRGTKDGL